MQVTLLTGETLTGKVRFISPRVDENTSLGRARIELPFNEALRPGSFAQANFEGSASGMLTVPASAIRYEAGGPSVMVVGEDNKVTQVPVKLGERTGDFVQLVEGPPAGSRVLCGRRRLHARWRRHRADRGGGGSRPPARAPGGK